eukprot:scaffold9043_cov57-Phaeocystis_antarctica.AAC.2
MVYAMRVLVLFVAAVNALPARTSTSLLAQDAPAPVVDAAAAPAAAVAPDYGAAAAATPVDASCVSIAPGANDFWCQTTCAIATNCPATMCACGDDAAKAKDAAASPAPVVAATGAPAAVAPAVVAPVADSTGAVAPDYAAAAPAAAVAAPAPDYGAAAATPNVDASCVSISASANDNWCQLTCAIPASCPVTMCKCGVTAEASPSPDAVPARSAVSLLAQDAPAPVVDAAAAVPVVAPDAAAAGAAAITPTDASCVSIAPGANDYWCQTTCFNPLSCPATMCACGDAAASPAPVVAAAGAPAAVAPAAVAAAPIAAPAPDYGAAAATPNVDASCVSISASANDNWCQLTCAIPASCPVTMCKCGVTAEASPSPDAVPARN